MITTGKEEAGQNAQWPGINGGLLRRRGPAPKGGECVTSYVCTIDVVSVDEMVAKVEKNGGTIAFPKMPVPGVGWLAYTKDTEDNIFGMMQADQSVK
jgi:predicted enzyme related to lactoylglutathione lyase